MLRSLVFGAAALLSVASGLTAVAQSPAHHGIRPAAGEYVVSSHVVSDQVISSTGGAVGGEVVADGAVGAAAGRYGRPDLFYNYYTQGYANQINAQMYLAPVPVPPNVGHTWYTYQPLMPHEFLYTHHNHYHNHYDNGRGTNRTHVSYRPSASQLMRDFYFNVRIPR